RERRDVALPSSGVAAARQADFRLPMRTKAPPETSTPKLLAANAAHLAAFETALASRPLHTRSAYLADARALALLAGEHDVAQLAARDVRRHLATLHA